VPPLADTWVWDGDERTSVNAPGPPARQSGVMAYDARRGKVVLFGGQGAPPQPPINNWQLSDTWTWGQ
jgi:hypothetical protein